MSLAGFSEDPCCRLETKGKGSNAVVSVEWTNWPDISWPDIYKYLILTPGVTHDQLKAYKSLEGYNFYVNGKVSNLVITEVPDTKNYLFTAVVKHSQALSIPPLKFGFAVKDTGEVVCGHCSCMAGVGEACAHVGSVFFVAEANTKTKQQMSSTSLPCAWLPCSEEIIDKSAVQTKKVCKMSPPTPDK